MMGSRIESVLQKENPMKPFLALNPAWGAFLFLICPIVDHDALPDQKFIEHPLIMVPVS